MKTGPQEPLVHFIMLTGRAMAIAEATGDSLYGAAVMTAPPASPG